MADVPPPESSAPDDGDGGDRGVDEGGVENEDHVLIFTTGGTIDKDYPRATSGYAFEFGAESAAHRILSSDTAVELAATHECVSLVRKDSSDIDDDDRDTIVRAICGAAEIAAEENLGGALRIVVTHGTDTLIETARYVKERLATTSETVNAANVVVAFVGAAKPERFLDSDAAFNLGCALGATSYLPARSVVVCMNGNVVDADECVRMEDTGLFRRRV